MVWLPLPEFRPHPLLRGGHAQTIAAAFWPTPDINDSPQLHFVQLADGDRLMLFDDLPAGWSRGGPVVLLIHGLGGQVRHGLLKRLADRLVRRGMRVMRMEMRGVGSGMYEARGWTHAGRSEDVASTLQQIERVVPRSPVSVIGFSMGGNQLLKMLGESGKNPPAQLERAIAVAPPVCLRSCSRQISRGLSRIYDLNFVKALNRQLQSRRRMVGFFDRKITPLPRRVREFDRELTAPMCGFSSVDDYYDRASSRHHVPDIHVPTMILVAEDDPVVPRTSFDLLQVPETVTLVSTQRGGHLGYLSAGQDDPDLRWLDWRLVELVTGERIAQEHE